MAYGTACSTPVQPAAEQAATTREQLLDAVAEHFAAQQVRSAPGWQVKEWS